MKSKYLSVAITLVTGCAIGAVLLMGPGGAPAARADDDYQPVPWSYVWGEDSVDEEDNWSAAPGMEGYTGADGNASGTDRGAGADPQAVLDDLTTGVSPVVHANELDMGPTTAANFAVVDFHPTTGGLSKPMIALHANSQFDAPFLLFHLDTTGRINVQIEYDVSDIDSSGTDATQQVALHYRVGSSGAWTNIPAGYIADATAPTAEAKRVTHITADLPSEAWDQPQVQFRVLTTNASGADEFIAVDNLSVTGTTGSGPTSTPPTTVPPTDPPPTPNPALNIVLYLPVVTR